MTTRTYRVQVVGRFRELAPEVRERLREDQPAHDVVVSGFTATGSFSYASSISRFTLRYQLAVTGESAVEADDLALVEGEVRALDYLGAHGITHGELRTTATCLDDVKRRRTSAPTPAPPVPTPPTPS